MENLFGFNIRQIHNRIKAKFSKKQARLAYEPYHLSVYIVNRCTNKCPMCFRNVPEELFSYKHQTPQDMTIDTFKEILERYSKAMKVGLGGYGDVFLNNDLFSMIELAASKKMKTNLITNGQLLGAFIERLALSPLNSISISINATNSKEYKWWSGIDDEGLFNELLKNIKSLAEEKKKTRSKLQLRGTFIITKDNFFKMQEMIELAKYLCIEQLDLLNLISSGVRDFTLDKCLFKDDEEVVRTVKELKMKEFSGLSISYPTLLSRKVTVRKCNWYFSSIVIDAGGNVGGCGRIIAPDKKYGNIFTDKDVWNLQHFQNMRKTFLDYNIPLHECCNICIENS